MRLSVIISTRNRADLLADTLKSLKDQALSQTDFEIIVVDNGSTDSTPEICDHYHTLFDNFSYFYDDRPGLHIGRAVGMQNARGDVLVYTDDDIIASQDWLKNISKAFEDEDLALLGGRILPKYEVEPPDWVENLWTKNTWGKMLYHYSLIDLGENDKQIPPYFVFGCNYSIRKAVIIRLGGFNPDALPDDLLRYRGDGETGLSEKIDGAKLKTLYKPDVCVWHRIPANRLTLEYIYKRAFNQGISDSYSQIRRSKGLNIKDSVLNFIRRQVSRKRYLGSGNAVLNRKLYEKYWEGFQFHQRETRNDPRLLDWVLQENYL